MKKWFLFTGFIVLLLLVACGGGDEGASGSDGDQTVVNVWFGREQFIPADQFERFHADNPDIKVEWDVVPLEQAVADYLRNHNTGNAPDVVQIFHEYSQTLAVQGAALNMSEYYEKWKEEDPDSYNKLLPQAFEIPSYEGDPYGLAIHAAPFWMAYRTDWFEEAGIEKPETWDDVLDAARTLKNEGILANNQYGYALPGDRTTVPLWFSSMFMSMGGQYTDSGLPIVDSDAGRYIVEFYQTLVREGLTSPEVLSWDSGDMRGSFMSGNAAMLPEGFNMFAQFQNELDFGTEWEGMVQPPRPGGEADFRVNMFSWPMIVNSDTEHPEAVLKVLQYLSDAEIVEEVAIRYQPTTNIEVMEKYYEVNEWAQGFQDDFASGVVLPSHLRQPEVYELMTDLKQEALSNPDRDPAEMVAEFQAKLDELD
ncbi:ABC transporter substrate-binding protein [Evansella tamaricis]|uniref:Sugar ABC transporter substrate-binding protein n=1 Tax=Evansella tamaricis TaxID=2069301 RepID=A0ABS6JA60_9BACI|nr:sugar ABC transporter substrate-binding protein [Evansella tamaricis]MBU9710569.1 sugar ABC transporter substrate-binding protein [Evansella tamaricis]